MKKTNRRGFTIVELVIVVAVIAILSAVLIPTFSGIINKANQSADIQAVRNMNVALATATDKPENIIEAAAVLSEAGFNTEKGLTPAYKGHSYYWFKPTNQVVYVNEADGKFELLFPEEVEGFNKEGCKSLDIAIAGVVNAPVVSETTVNMDNVLVDNVPEGTETFEDLVEWLNDGNDKHVRFTDEYSNERPGIALTGGTIKLSDNIVFDTPNTNSDLGNYGNTLMIHIFGEVTIDLNGYTITQKGYAASMNLFVLNQGSTLNIIDSSANQTGAILASSGVFQVKSTATLNLYSGNIGIAADEYRTDEDKENGSWLVNMDGGTFNMYGGTLDATTETLNDEEYGEYAISGYTRGNSTSVSYLYNGSITGEFDTEEYAGKIEDLR